MPCAGCRGRSGVTFTYTYLKMPACPREAGDGFSTPLSAAPIEPPRTENR
jgi:hypothetical protein